jgi:hypothetical protein
MKTVSKLRKDIALLIGEMVEQLVDAKVTELLLRRKRNRK